MGLTVVNGVVGRSRTASVELREAVTALSRTLEDVNWQNLSDAPQPGDADRYDDHRVIIERARKLATKSPLARFAVELLINYVLGDGVSLSANDKKYVAKIVDELWENPVNRAAFTSVNAMADFISGAYTDGAQYLVLFPDDKNGTLELSTLDSLLVLDVIKDKKNWRVPKWYKVRDTSGSDYDFKAGSYKSEGKTEPLWYRDWRNKDTAPRGVKVQKGLIMQCKRGKGKFGKSEMEAALDWIVGHKNFLEDRATLNRAAATIAWKKKVKGGPATISAEVDRIRSALVSQQRGYDTNPAPATGSTLVQNEAIDTEWMKTDTGGTSAAADERVLRMMVGSGLGGIPNHQFGDEASANLATALAMNAPLHRRFHGWQKWLADIITDVLNYALEVANEASRIPDKATSDEQTQQDTGDIIARQQPGAAGDTENADTAAPAVPSGAAKPAPSTDDMDEPSDAEFGASREPDGAKTGESVDWYVDVDFPPIQHEDPGFYMQALSLLYQMLPQGPEASKLIGGMALTAFGVNDVDKVLKRLFPDDGGHPGEGQFGGFGGSGLPPGATGFGAQLGAGQQPAGLLGPGQQGGRMQESMGPERVMRVITLARQAQEALSRA